MTLTAAIALARDIVILIALAALIWLLVSYGKDVVKVADIQAVQKQLEVNAQKQAQWAQESRRAEIERDAALAQVGAVIGAHSDPVYVVRDRPARACAVPAVPSPSVSASPPAGGIDAGPGIDLRPQISRFELRYETALADCRAALASWPQ